MNKKMMSEIVIATVPIIFLVAIVVLKTTLGDEVMDLSEEEGIEKNLNLQEENKPDESATDESNQYGEK